MPTLGTAPKDPAQEPDACGAWLSASARRQSLTVRLKQVEQEPERYLLPGASLQGYKRAITERLGALNEEIAELEGIMQEEAPFENMGSANA